MSRNWLTIRVWLLVITLSASLAGAPAYAQGAAAVRVDPSTSSVQVNSTANIAIKVDNIANLIAFELHLSFDPSVLEVTSLTNGGFVAADFTAQNVFDNATGTIDFAVAQMNRPPAQGSGALLNISFRAKANGSSTVTTRATQAAPSGLLLADQNGMAIQASWAPGTINVGASPSITNTPTNTSTPAAITNTPANNSTPTPITNTPANTSTPAPSTNTPTNTPSLALCPPTVPQGMAVVRFDPSTFSVKVDNVPKPPGLSAFEIHLSFDPNVLEVKSVSNGGFIVADFVAQDTFKENPNKVNAEGKFDYATSQRYRLPVGGSGTLLNIVFRAKTNGSSTVTTYSTPAAPNGLILSDANGMPIPVCWVPGTINGIQSGGTHVVRWGEWLYCIARAYRVSPWAIAEASGVRWPYMIFPGQKLTIPNVPWTNMTAGQVCKAQFTITTPTPIPPTPNPVTSTVTPTLTPAPVVTAPPSACRATHVVRSGETLYRIALQYGTIYTEIARVNGISNPRLIYPGQQLCIP